MSRIAKKVMIVHRRDTLRATKIYHDQLMNTENIEFCWNCKVVELLHEDMLTGVTFMSSLNYEYAKNPDVTPYYFVYNIN